MTELITGLTCANCKFSRATKGELVCARIPPTGHPIMAMTPKGPQMIGKVSIMPPVQPTGWCGEHVRRIEIASEVPE